MLNNLEIVQLANIGERDKLHDGFVLCNEPGNRIVVMFPDRLEPCYLVYLNNELYGKHSNFAHILDLCAYKLTTHVDCSLHVL